MCGIGGYSGDFPDGLVERFVEKLRHRGPDDHGVFVDRAAKIGLAHTRLSILDLSVRGHQPMRHPSGCVITYNGELYNFRSLRDTLVARGHQFESDSDTEVLLASYVEHGADMLRHLDGIFAFAIWDPRDRNLLLARDQLGVKPLYLATPGSGVLFASEIKALLASPAVSRELDVHALDATLRHMWCPGPRTVLAGVRKVEPGSALVIRDGRVVRHWGYFDLPVEDSVLDRDVDDNRHALFELLDRSVRDQLVSDVPVGAFLSGGLDSSTVVAFARRHVDRIPCFTIRFTSGETSAEGFGDDLPYARQVATHLGVELIDVPIGAEAADDLEQMIYQLDEPQADIAPLNVQRIAEAASDRGIKVLLSGTGGDDLFAGYRRHQAGRLERVWAWLPLAGRRALRALSRGLPQRRPLARRIVKAFRDADRDPDERLVGYLDWVDPATRARLFHPDLAARLTTTAPYQPLLDRMRELPRDLDPVSKQLYLDARYFLPDHNLNYTDKMAMKHGVEVRVPLLAVELARFATRLPTNQKVHRTTGKWILREAVRDLLPETVLHRSKTGFGVPLRTWIHRELAPLIGDVLSPSSLRARGIFDPRAVQELVDADRDGRVDAAYPILAIVAIELWCRAFLTSVDSSALAVKDGPA